MHKLIATGWLLFASLAGAADTEAETVDIQVTHLAERAAWRVRYQLSEPATELRFLRHFSTRRRSTWSVETPGLQLKVREDVEILVAAEGKAFTEVVLHFETDETRVPKDYQLNTRFTDGSVWLYTGHLYAKPFRDGVPDRKAEFRVELDSMAKEPIVLRETRYESGPVVWNEGDPWSMGTFVYFGTLEPVETAGVLAIVDPGLPPYLLRTLEESLPRLFRYYQEKTGYALPKRPAILIAFDPDGPGFGSGGDVLPGTISFVFTGPAWSEESPAHVRRAVHLIAHEAAHLWNSQLFDSGLENAAWLHEGGADAFAWQAMQDLGFLDSAGFEGRVQEALNQCVGLNGLSGESLQEAFGKRRFQFAYSCGAVMNLLVHFELRDRGGLFAFWRELFNEAGKTGNEYTLDQYLAVLSRMTGNHASARFLRKVWSGPLSDPAEAFVTELKRAGLSIEEGRPPPEETLDYARDAMGQLMSADCGGNTNFWTQHDHFRIGGLPQCKTMKAETIVITHLAGEPIKANGLAVYEAVSEQCGRGSFIEAIRGDGSKPLRLPCPKELRPLPKYWVVRS